MSYVRLWVINYNGGVFQVCFYKVDLPAGICWQIDQNHSYTMYKRKEHQFCWDYSHQSFLITQHVDNLKTTEAGSTGNKGTVSIICKTQEEDVNRKKLNIQEKLWFASLLILENRVLPHKWVPLSNRATVLTKKKIKLKVHLLFSFGAFNCTSGPSSAED